MDNFQHLIARLKADDNTMRINACRELELAHELTPAAIDALKQALYDPDPWVAQAARSALSAHWQDPINSPLSRRYSSSSPTATDKPSIIGNLKLNHVLFLLVATGLTIETIKEEGLSWGTLFVIFFFAGCLAIPGLISVNSHKKLLKIWSELAQQTGLELNSGRAYFIGNSIPPSLSGWYRGRRVSVSKNVHHEAAYEGSIPVVFTCMAIEVKNSNGASLTLTPKSSWGKIFKRHSARIDDPQLGRRYQISGQPDDFLRKALQLTIQQRRLFERPDKVIMRTDYPLSATNWRAPAIYLKDLQLTCMQSGVLTYIPGQVEMLNYLCDLAELTEKNDDGYR